MLNADVERNGDAQDDIATTLARYAAAWQRSDVATLVDCYADDIVLHWYGTSAFAGDHEGKPAALTALASLQQHANRRLLAVDDVLVGRTRGALLVRERFERDGAVLEVERVLVFRVAGGRLAECWAYDRDQRALDALWG